MSNKTSRRKFIYQAGLTALGLPLLGTTRGCLSPTQENKQKNGNKKLGVALVGLGGYSAGQLGPALLQTEHCYLAGIITGTPSKIPVWKNKYNLADKNIYSYDNYDDIVNNPDIDIVYIVLPNSMHAEYSIRGSRAGKHVICEKPMAVSVAECDAMIAAANKANKSLSIGYRLHYDPYHLEMIRLVKENTFGVAQKIDSAFSFIAGKGQWRLNKEMSGGGPLMDLGVYCLQAACYATGANPLAVTAQAPPVSDKTKFINVEETLNFQMEMPGGLIASCRTSYSENNNSFKISASNGWFELAPAFNYNGIRFNASNGRQFSAPAFSQQAAQLDDIALSIINKQPNKIPGEMGRRDLQIITAIYQAMESGKRVPVQY